ncbi:MAG: YidH family protein [Bacillus sp. (in: firmicutes)]
MTEMKSLDNQLKYVQQHLANERTYLAWIRTAISIVGVGFLATSLHFTIGNVRNSYIDILSVLLGVFSCIFGIVVILITTRIYKRKRIEILEGSFVPCNLHISLLSAMMVIFILLVLSYFFLILLG